MGPYRYETVYLSLGIFGAAKESAGQIQKKIDEYVEHDWELFSYHPVQTAFGWVWNVLIFRKPSR